MKRIRTDVKIVLALLFFTFSFTMFASDLPDPEALAKQYLKDLCALNEQEFVLKYTITQAEVEHFINVWNKSCQHSNEAIPNKLSDSLELRAGIQSVVLRSYQKFKHWQWENGIDSSNIKYIAYDFALEKRQSLPFYKMEDLRIYFSCDTLKYMLSCDDLVFVETKWVSGDLNRIYKTDNYFNIIYTKEAYNYPVATDTVAAADYYADEAVSVEGEDAEQQALSKKKLKIQKKVEAHYRKIDLLSSKLYE